MLFAFIFGKNWMLSLAEILAYLENEGIKFEFTDLTKKALILKAELNPEKTMEDLGGTLKIIEIKKQFDFLDLKKQEFGEYVEWPISFYGDRRLLKDLKKVFRNVPREGVLSHTDLVKRKIREVALIFGLKTCYFGETIAVSDPFEFQVRDIGRPVHWPELTISPSRARILVNLSQAKDNLLDPFCGTGTIGQEAMLRGVEKIFLSDIDKNCVKIAKKNIEWAKKKFRTGADVIIQTCDARDLKQKYKENSIQAVATEPELGPRLKERISYADAKKIIGYLSALYHAFFDSAYKILREKGRIAIVFPCIDSKQGKVFMEKFFPGFKLIDPLERIPLEYKDYLKTRKMILDEEREKGKKRIIIREFCIYKVKK